MWLPSFTVGEKVLYEHFAQLQVVKQLVSFACGSSIVAQFGSYLYQHGLTTNIQFSPFEV